MTDMAKVTVNWSGFIGGPGFTNLYFRAAAGGAITQGVADAATAKVHTWLTAWLGALPMNVTVTVDPSVEVVNDADGVLSAFFTTAPGAGRPGTGAGGYAAASGACINWYTTGIRFGRRVRGRSFMVPLYGGAFSTDGTIDDSKLSGFRTATSAMISTVDAAELAVWNRPLKTVPGSGGSHVVTASTIPDKAAILSSRRD